MKDRHEKEYLRAILSKNKLEMPFPEFEDELMMEVKALELERKKISGNLMISWGFFVAGAILGTILSFLLYQVKISISGISPFNVILTFQMLFSLFLLFGLESLIRHSRNNNLGEVLKEKFSTFHLIKEGDI